jgi:SAM-dependent methyltransferase
VSAPAYDRMGLNYSDVRRADPRIAAVIWDALGDAQSVVNVGAGTGSYEPADRRVVAVEPSPVMIAQRPPGAAPPIQGVAEDLPLADRSVDAAMGVFTMQHWQDVDRGLAEVGRVARRRVVFLTLDVEVAARAWLVRDYAPEIIEHDRDAFPSIERLASIFPGLRVDAVPIPGDCTDGFCIGLWNRPEAHLDPRVRAGSSIWHQLPEPTVEGAVEKLRTDLECGEWDRRYGHLREQASLDVGVRVVSAELRR